MSGPDPGSVSLACVDAYVRLDADSYLLIQWPNTGQRLRMHVTWCERASIQRNPPGNEMNLFLKFVPGAQPGRWPLGEPGEPAEPGGSDRITLRLAVDAQHERQARWLVDVLTRASGNNAPTPAPVPERRWTVSRVRFGAETWSGFPARRETEQLYEVAYREPPPPGT